MLQSTPNDVDILQFALRTEHLQRYLYTEALSTGFFSGDTAAYLTQFRDHESAHVQALADALTGLGTEPAAAPASYALSLLDSRETVLTLLKEVEDTVVSAYQGVAAAIDAADLLAAAGAILQTEARQASVLNFLLDIDPVPQAATRSLSLKEAQAALAPLMGV